MITRLISRTALPLAALSLAACGAVGTASPTYSIYDLGQPSAVVPPLAAVPSAIEVRSPTWLSTAAMQYRLAYRQPEQREAFLTSRWAAQPAELLSVALDRALAADAVAVSACRLHVHLDEFEQVFDAPEKSRARLVARVEVMPARSEIPLARRTFTIETSVARPDAAGGVLAHRAGLNAFSAELRDWLHGLDQAGTQGLNTNGRCKR